MSGPTAAEIVKDYSNSVSRLALAGLLLKLFGKYRQLSQKVIRVALICGCVLLNAVLQLFADIL